MIRKSLSIALLLAGVTAKLYAQEKINWTIMNKADATFNMYEQAIHHRHSVTLNQGTSMTIELYTYNDYQKLQDVEALLAQAKTDLAFVEDTIRECPECSYRIDYLTTTAGMKNYRIRKYEPQGTFLYEKKGSGRKPFKSEADTLKISVAGSEDRGRQCQITFILNRFSNLDSLLARKGTINSIVDTFIKRAAPKNRAEKKWPWAYQSTIFMYKNRRDTSKTIIDFRRNQVVKDRWDYRTVRSTFGVQPNIGAGFIRDRIAPAGEIGVTYRLPATKGKKISSVLGLYASGYFAFEKNTTGGYTVNDNWFLNAEIGDEGENMFTNYITTTRLTVGAGYLVHQKGDYFQHTTMKIFMNIRIKNGITLSPEIIATDNFKQAFPGITIKLL